MMDITMQPLRTLTDPAPVSMSNKAPVLNFDKRARGGRPKGVRNGEGQSLRQRENAVGIALAPEELHVVEEIVRRTHRQITSLESYRLQDLQAVTKASVVREAFLAGLRPWLAEYHPDLAEILGSA